jgi:hypothetical protein
VSTVTTETEPRTESGVARHGVEPMVLKAAGRTHVVVAVFCMLPFILGLAPQLLDRPPVIELLVIGAAIGFLAIVWVRSFRIELTPDEFRYRSLFGGSRGLRYEAIESARIQVGVRVSKDRWKPHYRLVLTPKAGATARPIVVNLKVFAFEPLKKVCAAVDAVMDD